MFTFGFFCIRVGTHKNTVASVPLRCLLSTGYTQAIHKLSTELYIYTSYPKDIPKVIHEIAQGSTCNLSYPQSYPQATQVIPRRVCVSIQYPLKLYPNHHVDIIVILRHVPKLINYWHRQTIVLLARAPAPYIAQCLLIYSNVIKIFINMQTKY